MHPQLIYWHLLACTGRTTTLSSSKIEDWAQHIHHAPDDSKGHQADNELQQWTVYITKKSTPTTFHDINSHRCDVQMTLHSAATHSRNTYTPRAGELTAAVAL